MSKARASEVLRRAARRPAGNPDEAERWLRIFEVLQRRLQLEDDDEYTARMKRLRKSIKAERDQGVCGDLLAVREVWNAREAARLLLCNRLRSLLGR